MTYQSSQDHYATNQAINENPMVLTDSVNLMGQKQAQPSDKRSSHQTTKSNLSAFVTQQNQSKSSRMQKDNLTKSHMSIGNPATADNLLDPQNKKSGSKGSTSRREAGSGE